MNRLEQTRDRIVNKAFPELTGVNIGMNWKKMKDAYLESTLDKQGFAIDVDTSLRKAPDTILEGGMAHELAHIAIEHGIGTMISMIDNLLYKLSKRYRTWDERRTDSMAIERGYGPQLYAFTVYANERRKKFDREDGLTANEILNLLEQKEKK